MKTENSVMSMIISVAFVYYSLVLTHAHPHCIIKMAGHSPSLIFTMAKAKYLVNSIHVMKLQLSEI